MVLICDRAVSVRALRLRERMLKSGLPVSVSAFSHIREYRPLKLIVTFGDVFDDLRRTPNTDIFAVVIGTQFVNSALNATRVPDEAEAFRVIRRSLRRSMGIPEQKEDPLGFYLNPDFYWSEHFFTLRGRMLLFTKTERLIFLYLYVMTDEKNPANARKLARFCFPAARLTSGSVENRIAAHIANINAKTKNRFTGRLIRDRRGAGYWMDHSVI